MDINQAKQIQEDEIKRKAEFTESTEVIAESERKAKEEQAIAEKAKQKQEFEQLKKAFPEKSQEVFSKCWKCGRVVNMSQGQLISKSGKILRIKACSRCKSFNVEVIPTNNPSTSEYDRILNLPDYNY